MGIANKIYRIADAWFGVFNLNEYANVHGYYFDTNFNLIQEFTKIGFYQYYHPGGSSCSSSTFCFGSVYGETRYNYIALTLNGTATQYRNTLNGYMYFPEEPTYNPTKFESWVNGYKTEVQIGNILNINNLSLSTGSHFFKAKAISCDEEYLDSEKEQVYNVYPIINNVIHGSITGGTSLRQQSSVNLTLVPDSTYYRPEGIGVTNATKGTYNTNTGTFSVSNPYGPISISGECYRKATLSLNLTNCTVDTKECNPWSTVIVNDLNNNILHENVRYEITVRADANYVLPETVTVTGMPYDWVIQDELSTVGTLFLDSSGFTDNTGVVGVTITAEAGHFDVGVTIYAGGVGGCQDGPYLWPDWDGTTNTNTWMNNHTPISLINEYTYEFVPTTEYFILGFRDCVPPYEEADNYYFEIYSYNGDIELLSGHTSAFHGTYGTIETGGSCVIEDTDITLADGSTKKVQDITYDDELLVWDFYNGCLSTARPQWIRKQAHTSFYNELIFENGVKLGLAGPGLYIGYHRIWNNEARAFTHTGVSDTPDGTTTFTQDQKFIKLVSQQVVHKEMNYYNIITEKHYNLFANGILTSCRLSNRYDINDMKYDLSKINMSDDEVNAYFEKIDKLKL